MLRGTKYMSSNADNRIKSLEERLAIVERQLATCLHAYDILADRVAEEFGDPLAPEPSKQALS